MGRGNSEFTLAGCHGSLPLSALDAQGNLRMSLDRRPGLRLSLSMVCIGLLEDSGFLGRGLVEAAGVERVFHRANHVK
jgi:hypothetical protein